MTKTKRTLGAASAILATACGAFALHGQDSAAEGRSSDTPPEFGDVDWGRKLQDGLSASRDSKKPVMLLFQEVPG